MLRSRKFGCFGGRAAPGSKPARWPRPLKPWRVVRAQHPRRRRRPRAPGDAAPRRGLGRLVGRHAGGAAGHRRRMVPGTRECTFLGVTLEQWHVCCLLSIMGSTYDLHGHHFVCFHELRLLQLQSACMLEVSMACLSRTILVAGALPSADITASHVVICSCAVVTREVSQKCR